MDPLTWAQAKTELEAGNYERARDLLELLVDDREAKLQLAYLLQAGLGGDVDVVRAQNIYQSLANDGDAEGMYYAGRLFLAGGDLFKAVYYLEMSSSLSHASASFWGAELYNGLYGYPRDERKYRILIRRAANLGHIYALRNCALDDIQNEKNIFLKIRACLVYIAATGKGVVIAFKDPNDLRLR
jgi:TPR repeat protein